MSTSKSGGESNDRSLGRKNGGVNAKRAFNQLNHLLSLNRIRFLLSLNVAWTLLRNCNLARQDAIFTLNPLFLVLGYWRQHRGDLQLRHDGMKIQALGTSIGDYPEAMSAECQSNCYSSSNRSLHQSPSCGSATGSCPSQGDTLQTRWC